MARMFYLSTYHYYGKVLKRKSAQVMSVNDHPGYQNETLTTATLISIISHIQTNDVLEIRSSYGRSLLIGHCPLVTEKSLKYALSRYRLA